MARRDGKKEERTRENRSDPETHQSLPKVHEILCRLVAIGASIAFKKSPQHAMS